MLLRGSLALFRAVPTLLGPFCSFAAIFCSLSRFAICCFHSIRLILPLSAWSDCVNLFRSVLARLDRFSMYQLGSRRLVFNLPVSLVPFSVCMSVYASLVSVLACQDLLDLVSAHMIRGRCKRASVVVRLSCLLVSIIVVCHSLVPVYFSPIINSVLFDDH